MDEDNMETPETGGNKPDQPDPGAVDLSDLGTDNSSSADNGSAPNRDHVHGKNPKKRLFDVISAYSKKYYITIDSNETAHKDVVSNLRGVCVEIYKANLTTGDMAIRKSSNHDVIAVIERKTYADMVASINDGRYKEQFNRMLETGCRHIFYLMTKSKISFEDQKRIISATLHMSISGNCRCHIIQLEDKNLMSHAINRMIGYLDEFYSKKAGEPPGIPYDPFVNPKCKKIIDPGFFYVNALKLIRSVSNDRAIAIKDKIPNFQEFLKNLKREGRTYVSDNVKGIGKAISANIFMTILGNDYIPKKDRTQKNTLDINF